MKKIGSIAVLLTYCLIVSCSTSSPTDNFADESSFANPVVTKWYNNKSGTISLTYDNMYYVESFNQKLFAFLEKSDIRIGFETVTDQYLLTPSLKEYAINVLKPKGYNFFGHGHKHINHDTLSYELAYDSFKLCYETMKAIGLKPVAYAYPEGRGQNFKTQLAVAAAGFLSARNAWFLPHNEYFIMPDNTKEPKNWYLLPTLVMWDKGYLDDNKAVKSATELIPYLDECIRKTAWVTAMFHNIGNPGANNYGWFSYDEFVKCVEEIQKRDFWVASMSDVTLYVREKNKTVIDIDYIKNSEDQIDNIVIKLIDNLPNDIYDHPLTVIVEIPERWVGRTIRIEKSGKLVSQLKSYNKNITINLLPDEQYYNLILN